jgi:hypothetical protein
MATELSLKIPGSNRNWLKLRAGSNPLSAAGGPLPQLVLPLEARVTDSDITIEILRLSFDLKLGPTLIGKGEIGPLTHLQTDEYPFAATATCPRDALPALLDPSPKGRVSLGLSFKGLFRYRHSYETTDDRAQRLGDADRWHLVSFGEQSAYELEITVARSDWYDQVAVPLGLGSYLVTPISLPNPAVVSSWKASLEHLEDAARALTLGDPPAVFGYCRAAIDALPGDKTQIFDAMPEGKKRDAINTLTKEIGIYLHSGRHVVPNTGGHIAGDFPVDQRDAAFVLNMTKLLLSQIVALTLES